MLFGRCQQRRVERLRLSIVVNRDFSHSIHQSTRVLPVTDTRPFFRPLCRDIVTTLRTLEPEDWLRPTLAGSWRVRDVAAHLLDTALRRLSAQRDRWWGSRGGGPIAVADLVALINDLNATWIRSADRLSPRVLSDLYEQAGAELSDLFEALRLDDPATLPVSWAGETESSAQWLDIGREFTEIWHHGSQIREAVGAGPFRDARWLRAVLEISMHALPHAYRQVNGPPDLSIVLDITGPAAGTWTLTRRAGGGWDIAEGTRPSPAMKATMTGEVAWRLLFNALTPAEAQRLVQIQGDSVLASPLWSTRSVIV